MANFESVVRRVPCLKCVSRSVGLLQQLHGSVDVLRASKMLLSSANDAVTLENPITRAVPKNSEEEKILNHLKWRTPSNPRILSATIIGMPNAGKSTLINALMGWRVASVSKKVHTTLHNTQAVIVEGNAQIVLLDTPGIVSRHEMRKHNLEEEMLTEPKTSVSDVDLIIALVDVSNVWHRRRLDGKLFELLKKHDDKRAILVLNKVDLLTSKRILLDATHRLTEGFIDHVPIMSGRATKPKAASENELERILTRSSKESTSDGNSNQAEIPPKNHEDYNSPRSDGWPHFERVFMVSAREKDGVEDLKDYLMTQTISGDWRCSPHIVTNEKPHEIIKLAVREKLLDNLPQEIPYNLNPKIESMEVDQHGTMHIAVSITVLKEHHMKLVIGGGGCIIKKVADGARQELMNTFRCDVLLKLIVQSSHKLKEKSKMTRVNMRPKKYVTTKMIKSD